MLMKQELFKRRKKRSRARLRRLGSGRPRLSVFRSGKHIYAQVIDDGEGKIVVAASSLEKEVRGELKTGADKEAAGRIGRGAFRYHGRVKALAEAAREGGLNF